MCIENIIEIAGQPELLHFQAVSSVSAYFMNKTLLFTAIQEKAFLQMRCSHSFCNNFSSDYYFRIILLPV